MEHLTTYVALFGIIIFVGVLSSKSPIPTALILVIVGMALSFVPELPHINLNPGVVLNIFLPMLLYQISSSASWKDVKKNMRPIALLSIGHVLFIATLVAITIHALIPQLSWPFAFILGAVISPPDDVAIVAIAEKIRMPRRIVTILEGEGIFNDATALLLFRLGLLAMVTYDFSVFQASSTFIVIIIGEAFYGLALGYILGELRLKINDPILHMLTSLLTPFLAYLPVEKMGGSGVLATVVTGFVIGNIYSSHFTPDFRLLSRAVWPTLAFAIESILFILIGLDLRFILESISTIPFASLALYSGSIIFVVIVGRFIWVYLSAYIPQFLFPSILKKDPYPPWEYLFVISWAGMRGGISLAAALAVPLLPSTVDGANSRDLLIFLVFCVIAATLVVQGLTLPWLLKVLKIHKYSQREKYDDHLAELSAKLKMAQAVLRWLKEYGELVKDDSQLLNEIKLRTHDYRMLKKQYLEKINQHSEKLEHNEKIEMQEFTFLSSRIIAIERSELSRLWQEEKINHSIRNKLQDQLDHRFKHLS